ncbi:MAG: AsmA-like C-terminal domain-containing protein [Alphaproteobacteria bacterium]|nr:AsmA-like C-terminal domain-containing protein [Alphaproteobacteria bacterium]
MKKLSARAYFLKKTVDCFIAGLFVVLLLFLWTLYKGPISVPYLKPYIIQALNYDENDYQVGIGDVNIEFVRSIQPLRVTAKDVSLRKKDDSVYIEAPKLYMSFSLRALMKGIIAPSDINLINPSANISTTYGVKEENINESGKKKLQFYVERINEFLDHYNSEDKIYPESYVNNITIKNGELEFNELDFGRVWLLSDVNFEFSRNFINMDVNANALININDKIASAGFESEYHASDDKLDLEVYFSDLILSDILSTFNETTEENLLSVMSVEVPANGKVNTVIKLEDIRHHPEDAQDYLSDAIERIDFELDGGQGYISFEGNEKYNYEIDEMQLSGIITGGIDEVKIEKAELKMGGQNAQLSLYANGLETFYLSDSLRDLAVSFKVNVPEFPLSELSRFWPRYLAEPGWEWCKNGLTGGIAKNGEFIFDFGYNRKDDTWGLQNLKGKAYLEDGDIFYLDGMPYVNKVYGTANFTQKNISIDIDKGISDGVMITGGNVNIYDLNKEDNFISIKLIGNSSVKDALKLIDHKPLNFASEIGINPQDVQGNVDVKLGLDFELRQDLEGKDIKVNVDADLHNVEITKLIPEHKLSSDGIKLKVNSKGWSIDGDAKFDDIPLQLKMNEKFAEKAYKSKCNISFLLNEQAKKTLGLDWALISSPNIEGAMSINADITVKKDNLIDIDLMADLKNTKLDYSYLGFEKAYGQPSTLKAKVSMLKDKVTSVSVLNLSKAGFSIGGNVVMYPSGRVKTVDINKIDGPKTSARAKISLNDKAEPDIKVEVSGMSYDLTPLFDKADNKSQKTDNKIDVKPENEDDGLEKVNNTDIFITVNSLWTNSSTPIKNFAGSAKLRKGTGIDEVNIVGNYGIDKSIKLNLSYIPRGNKEHYLSINSNNAGSTLKVLRLYDNMVGGTLKIEARRLQDKKFIGHATVRDFSIQNAPVMAKLLSVASFTGMLDLLKGDGLTFTHFNAPLEYQYKTLKLNHAKAEGNVVGITVNGTYNRASDDLGFYGVIAPAYSLNRFLGKIPVVGNLLASKDGTIFAADYKIDGSVDEPEVDINSLSILSPNSMKEWYNKNFGNGDDL